MIIIIIIIIIPGGDQVPRPWPGSGAAPHAGYYCCYCCIILLFIIIIIYNNSQVLIRRCPVRCFVWLSYCVILIILLLLLLLLLLLYKYYINIGYDGARPVCCVMMARLVTSSRHAGQAAAIARSCPSPSRWLAIVRVIIKIIIIIIIIIKMIIIIVITPMCGVRP